MTSAFGDVYDHTSDIGYWVALGGVVCIRYRHKVCALHVIVCIIMISLLLVSMGCTQRSSEDGSGGDPTQSRESLDHFRGLCWHSDWFRILRWFGPGTFMMGNIVMIVHILLRTGGCAR